MSCSVATLSGRRKDTAAYASLSFFTCQRANIPPRPETGREPRNTPSTLARRDPEASSRTTTAMAPSMKMYLADPGLQVNTHSEEFPNFSSVYLRPNRQTKQTRSQKMDFFWVVLIERTGPLDEYSDFAPEEPSDAAK
jgi:hypothetical protein